jgi:hypothetical protein
MVFGLQVKLYSLWKLLKRFFFCIYPVVLTLYSYQGIQYNFVDLLSNFKMLRSI